MCSEILPLWVSCRPKHPIYSLSNESRAQQGSHLVTKWIVTSSKWIQFWASLLGGAPPLSVWNRSSQWSHISIARRHHMSAFCNFANMTTTRTTSAAATNTKTAAVTRATSAAMLKNQLISGDNSGAWLPWQQSICMFTKFVTMCSHTMWSKFLQNQQKKKCKASFLEG